MSRRTALPIGHNADSADSLALLLTLGGHTTRVALSSEEALDCAAAFEPQIALLDIGLPRMDGYELARRLRCAPKMSAVRLVALTGYGQAEHRERALRAGSTSTSSSRWTCARSSGSSPPWRGSPGAAAPRSRRSCARCPFPGPRGRICRTGDGLLRIELDPAQRQYPRMSPDLVIVGGASAGPGAGVYACGCGCDTAVLGTGPSAGARARSRKRGGMPVRPRGW